MSLRQLPRADLSRVIARPHALTFDAPSDALERFTPFAAAKDQDTISILEQIGSDWFGEGVTAKRIAGALRAIGDKPVRVDINSPGGDFFEGLAIYNMLADHPAKVTVRVLGIAASAASIIAMAGDEIEMGAGSFLMIHNAWAVAIGNQNDLRDAADMLAPFDASMASLYAARTGMSEKAAAALMDAETWISAHDAVAQKFADSVINLPDPPADSTSKARAAQARLDALLAKSGTPRAERRRLIREVKSDTPSAVAESATPRAGDDEAALWASLQQLSESLSKK